MSIWDSIAATIAAEQESQNAAKALADNASEENRRKYSALYAPYHSRIQALVDDYLTRKPLLANCHHTMMVGESLVVGVTVRANRSWLIWDCDANGRKTAYLSSETLVDLRENGRLPNDRKVVESYFKFGESRMSRALYMDMMHDNLI